jgi:hypothetical protein
MSRKIFTFTHLSDKLYSELSWRRKELILIYSHIKPDSSPISKTLLRAAIPFLYAHWEGYVKIVAETYLEFVANKYEKISDLKTSFAVLAIDKKTTHHKVNEFEQKVQLFNTLINEFDKKANIPVKDVIQTKSNLWYNVFEEILFILGLDSINLVQYKVSINDLVDTRNHIAHGHYLKINYDQYKDIHTDVISAMSQLKTEIENSAIQFHYKNLNRFAS